MVDKMLPTNVRLDPYTTYSIVLNEIENRTKVLIDINRKIESDNIDEIVIFSKEDLEKYWKTMNNSEMCLQVEYSKEFLTKRYFLLDIKNNLIFIPLSNKDKNIVNYTVTNLIYLDKIKIYNFYLSKNKNQKYAKNKSCSLHSIILDEKIERGFKLDHANSDGLDNRIENLRKITDLENTVNISTSDKLIGIVWRPKISKWESAVNIGKKYYSLGTYEDKIEAAKQYDRMSILLYPGIKQLNQIDGKPLLTIDEINDVKNNPKKYEEFLYRNVNKGPPKNVRETCRGTYTYYKELTKFFENETAANKYLKNFQDFFNSYKINALIKATVVERKDCFSFNVKISKNFKTIEKAKELGENIKEYIKNVDKILRDELENNIDNYRNEDGVAVIKTVKRVDGEKTYVDVLVTDEDWRTFIHYNWHVTDFYPVNDEIGILHIEIFKKYYPVEYANRKPGETVDHKNRNMLDATIQNLRLANKSLQAQNRYLGPRKCLSPYPCVYIANGGFYAMYKNKRINIKYQYAEDAARQYNEVAYKDNPNSRLNEIPDKKTTVSDIYGIENLKQIDINSITTVIDIQEIFRMHGWHKGLFGLKDIRLKDIEKCKKIIIDNLNKY